MDLLDILISQLDKLGIKLTSLLTKKLLLESCNSLDGIKYTTLGCSSMIKTKAINKLLFSSPKSCFAILILCFTVPKSICCKYIWL